jgi:hypothetical protein
MELDQPVTSLGGLSPKGSLDSSGVLAGKRMQFAPPLEHPKLLLGLDPTYLVQELPDEGNYAYLVAALYA